MRRDRALKVAPIDFPRFFGSKGNFCVFAERGQRVFQKRVQHAHYTARKNIVILNSKS
jgi:hypothetical protein